MSFFDKVLKVLGFADENEEQNLKEKKQKKTNANFDLSKIEKQNNPNTLVCENQKDVQKVIDELKNNMCVVCNLEKLTDNDFARTMDFLSGAVYALGGKFKKKGEKTFLISLYK